MGGDHAHQVSALNHVPFDVVYRFDMNVDIDIRSSIVKASDCLVYSCFRIRDRLVEQCQRKLSGEPATKLGELSLKLIQRRQQLLRGTVCVSPFRRQ